MPPSCPRVAIIDDSASDASILELAMRRAEPGVQVARFATVDKALAELSDRSDFDLIICDLRLGGENGLDFLKHTQERCASFEVPVVITSSFCPPEDVDQCYRLGAKWYFEKPFTLPRAVEIVNELISRWLKK